MFRSIREVLIISLFLPAAVIIAQTSEVVPAFEQLSSFPSVRDFSLSNDGREAWFSLQSAREELSQIAVSYYENGQWSTPELAPFSGPYRDLEPSLSPDNMRLYFASNRPGSDGDSLKVDFDIWYCQRQQAGGAWSEPINLGAPVNTSADEFYPSLSKDGSLYFTSNRSGGQGKDDIFVAHLKNNRYQTPLALDSSINSAGYEFNAYIDPDQRFLIFSAYNRDDGMGSGDLYISLWRENEWQPALNLGAGINSQAMDYCPFVDQANSLLYFSSRRSLLQAASFASLEAYRQELNQYANGMSRIYKIAFDWRKYLP